MALVVCMVLLLSGSTLRAQVVDGRIDLTGPDTVLPTTLDGEWSFHWGALEDPTATPSDLGTMKTVPSRWKPGAGRPEESRSGVATYRLLLKVPTESDLALYVPPIDSAYEIYLDGALLGRNGTVSPHHEEVAIEEYSPQVFPFTVEGAEHRLVVHMANYGYPRGGLDESITVGYRDSLFARSRRETAFDLMLFGVLAIMALYHAIVYSYRPSDRAPLYFALLCAFIATRLLVTGDGYLYRISAIDWRFGTSIEYLMWYLTLAPFVLFIDTVFHEVSPRRIAYGLVGASVLFAIFVVVTPVGVFTRSIYVADVLTALVAVYGLAVGVSATVRKRHNAAYLLVGAILLALTVTNDILYANNTISTRYLAPAGLTMFAVAQAFYLARRFSDAFSEVERLSEQLAGLNDTLEDKVCERTQRLERAYSEIRTLSERDPLTGAFNRRYLEEALRRELAKARRYHHVVSVAMGDLDNFKRINDNFGHRVGDEVIRGFVEISRAHMREHVDWIARYGGEEFVVVLPETDTPGAVTFADRVRRAVEAAPRKRGEESIVVTVSFGVASTLGGAETGAGNVDDLVDRADRQLYRAKQLGKNRVVHEGDLHDTTG